MTVDRDTLIELYKTTLEEFHHHDRIYVQAISGAVVLIPVFLIAASFLLGKDSPVSSQYIPYVKWGLLGLAILFASFVWWNLHRIDERLRICSNVIGNIEGKLISVQTAADTDEAEKLSELSTLLVMREMSKIKVKRFGQIRFGVYLFVILVVLTLFGLLLFVCIE